MKGTVYILFYSWQCGGVETRAYRFFLNLKSFGVKVRIISVFATDKTPKSVLVFPDVEFVSRKKMQELLKEIVISKEDVLFLFRPGSRNDSSHFEKFGLEKMPFYFEHLEKFKKAKKIVYVYGNAETQPFPYYEQVIELMDFCASGFLVEKDREQFVIIDSYQKKKVVYFKKPIWWFNISFSPFERKRTKNILENFNEFAKNKEEKSVLFTGRITPEKNVVRILRSFLFLKKKGFDCCLFGTADFSRERWYAEQKFGVETIKEFFRGNYNGIIQAKKILPVFNFGINLRKKNLERYHILEQTTLEYALFGVVPVISKNFLPEKEFEIPFRSLIFDAEKEDKEEDYISELIIENYKSKKMDMFRRENMKHILRYNDGRDVVRSFLNFLKNKG
jgi:glycosyltransferase involved in cell wall biosynthesis